MPMSIQQDRFIKLVRSLIKAHGTETAMRLAPGGEFEAIGILERELLIQHGLQRDGYLIDVGCGPGRLARPLSEYLDGKYLGIDVVPEVVAYARKLVKRPDWRFEIAPGLTIPEKAGRADMVCFFSVFTHLPHEQSYLYLQEAIRVLKPQGKIVFSFLEFAVAGHWPIFETTVQNVGMPYPPNVFLSRDAIEAWAAHLNLQIELIAAGDEPHIPLAAPVQFENKATMEGQGCLGQSVCVLRVEKELSAPSPRWWQRLGAR
ncbi:MAG: class I SAM-dependent methyltransferase [Acidobacteria bacterium]|nr:MAG: class I SAM-dependent methyltransferase [Acidobacteriota bacterium]